jgi:hypothetical protein
VTIALPLTAWRNEVRPEQISYLLLGILILILILSDKQKIKTSIASLMIFFIMLFWVNLHIFFGMGLFTIGCFYLGKALEQNSNNYKQKLLNPFLILGLAGLAGALINPNGISGLLQPLTIFQNFGYQLAENQSVFFMHKRFPFGVIYYYYDLLACLGFFASILFITKNHQKLSSVELSLFVLSAVFMILGFNTTRSMPNFAFVSIPLLSIALGKKLNNSPVKTLITSLVILLVFFGFYYQFYKKEICLGVPQGQENSAKFFLENKIQGPIFNNYDIGGYLIFYLYPEHKVFVDNRPEAYPKEFFSKIYEPMQADEKKWQEIDKQYNFNAIFFMRQDMTQHAQPFLIRRVRDPNWVVVFVDDSNIILVKNNLLNQELIKRYGLPASMFKAVKQ